MSYWIRDILLASILLILTSPLFLIISILLFFSQKQVFFLQQRPGLYEKPFVLIKFCTMRPLQVGEQPGVLDACRMTYWGTLLRKYSLNELPQLVNVIRGDMSLVGPRPLLMDYLPLYTSEEKIRHQVKPGITGWAQIHGRNQLSFKQRFQYDIWYVCHRNHKLDLHIMLKTFVDLINPTRIREVATTFNPKYDGSN